MVWHWDKAKATLFTSLTTSDILALSDGYDVTEPIQVP
jgi:hypothetical protein